MTWNEVQAWDTGIKFMSVIAVSVKLIGTELVPLESQRTIWEVFR